MFGRIDAVYVYVCLWQIYCMYVCLYVYYVCLYMFRCFRFHICVSACLFVWLSSQVLSVSVCACMCPFMCLARMCVCECMFVIMFLYVSVFVYIYIYYSSIYHNSYRYQASSARGSGLLFGCRGQGPGEAA
jgi:hypothetical protein